MTVTAVAMAMAKAMALVLMLMTHRQRPKVQANKGSLGKSPMASSRAGTNQ